MFFEFSFFFSFSFSFFLKNSFASIWVQKKRKRENGEVNKENGKKSERIIKNENNIKIIWYSTSHQTK